MPEPLHISGRLKVPEPPLADDAIRLQPLGEAQLPEFLELIEDPAVKRFTLVATEADEEFVRGWLRRYADGWDDGSRAGFWISSAGDAAFLGFAAIVHLDLAAREGEIGYMIAPAARGRGASARAIRLVTRWGFEELGLERLELRIDVTNLASERVAQRAGYRREGVLRNVHVKEGLRSDTGIWSRLATDE
jgi:RimJ/RimL family protein N-acetyltransferase